MIEIPAEIWRPKVVSRYTIPEYVGDNIDIILDYDQYGKCVYKTKLVRENDTNRDNIIIYNESLHSAELESDLGVDPTIDAESKATITAIIKEYWDCLVKDGTKRTILDYEFGIDTGSANPVCCKKPSYGPYELKVIMTQVNQLLGKK